VLQKAALESVKSPVKAQYANLALAYFSGFDKDVRKFYSEALDNQKADKETRSAIAMASGLGGLSMTQPALLKIAKDAGTEPKTRAYAALAYGMVSQASAKDAAKELRGIYRDFDDANGRRGAHMGLGFVGDRSDVPFLLNVLEAKEDQLIVRYTRGAAVMALGMIRDGESIARIAELTGKADPRTRAFAIAALGYLADKDTAPAMSELFENANFRKDFGALEAVMHQL